MARKWSNQNLPGALHYITGNFLDRQRVLIEERYFNAFIEPSAKLLREWPCKLIAYALMPDHIHMIVNPRDGGIREFTGRLKGLCAKSLVSASPSGKFKVNEEGIHQVAGKFQGRSFMERLDDLAEDQLHSPESS